MKRQGITRRPVVKVVWLLGICLVLRLASPVTAQAPTPELPSSFPPTPDKLTPDAAASTSVLEPSPRTQVPLQDALQPLPTLPPGIYPDHPPKVRNGRVQFSRGRLGNTRWRYRLVNGTDQPVSSVHLVIPSQFYDSRIIPSLPYFGLPGLPAEAIRWPFYPSTWTTRRDRGQGRFEGSWVISWLATDPSNLLPPGRALQVDLQSAAAMTESSHPATMLCASTRSEHLQFPWDDRFAPVLLSPHQDGRPDVSDWQAPFPVFSNNELTVPPVSLQEAEKRFRASIDIWASGLRYGDQLTLTIRTRVPLVTTLSQGDVLLPSHGDYDILVVGRDERLALNLGEQASIPLRAFSLTHDRKAMPKRYDVSALGYHLAQDADLKAFSAEAVLDAGRLAAVRQVLRRAQSLRPVLTTALGARYEDALVQWGIWRKLALLEGRPLHVADLERDLSLYWIPLAQGKKQYLNAIAVATVAKLLWSDTEALLYDEPRTASPSS